MPGRARPRASQRLLGSSPSGIRVRISAPTLRPDGGWRRPVAPLRGPRSRGTRAPTWWSSEAAIRGCGLPGTCSIRSPASVSSSWRAGSAATARAGETAGSASRSGSARPRSATRFGDDAARSLLDASSETVGAIGGVVRRQRRGRLVRPVRLPGRLDRRGVRRRGARDASRPPARSAGRTRCTRSPRRRSASGWTRPCSGAACSFPTSRPCIRRGWRSACASGCWSGASRSSRTRALSPSQLPVRSRRVRKGGRFARRPRCSRWARPRAPSARCARACR